MDFKFTPEEQDIISMLHDFCIKEVQPIAAELDEQERFPTETVNMLGEMGMMGIPFPENTAAAASAMSRT
jgi:butyryl-CoA dehydrogenase